MKPGIGKRGSITNLLLLFVLIAAVYVGIAFARPYIRYNTLRSHTTDILQMELKSLPAIKEQVLADAAELKIPLSEEKVEVTMSPMKVVKVRAAWSETVNFWDYYQKQLDFVMEVDY
jgi:hypothetical protein